MEFDKNNYPNIIVVEYFHDTNTVNLYLKSKWILLDASYFEGCNYILGWDKQNGDVVYPNKIYDEDWD